MLTSRSEESNDAKPSVNGVGSALIWVFSHSSDWIEKTLGNDAAAYFYGIVAELMFFIANLGILLIDNMDSSLALMLRGICCMAIAQVISEVQSVPLHLSEHLFKVRG